MGNKARSIDVCLGVCACARARACGRVTCVGVRVSVVPARLFLFLWRLISCSFLGFRVQGLRFSNNLAVQGLRRV